MFFEKTESFQAYLLSENLLDHSEGLKSRTIDFSSFDVGMTDLQAQFQSIL